jgi:hypothetical protein
MIPFFGAVGYISMVNPPDPYRLAQETQGVLLIVLLVGVAISGRDRRGILEVFAWFGISAALRTLVDDPNELWTFYIPAGAGLLPSYWFILCLLALNLAFVYCLVTQTGGSELSSFTSLYLMMPTFALLILGVRIEVFIYALFALLCFTSTMFSREKEWYRKWISDSTDYVTLVRRTRQANLWFSTACLGLVILIDYRNNTLSRAGVEHDRVSPTAAHPSPSVEPQRAESPTPTDTPAAARSKKERAIDTPAPTATARTAPTITPRETPTPASTPQAKPTAAIAPVDSPAPAPHTSSSQPSPREKDSSSQPESGTSHSYPVFLTQFYSPKLTAKQRARYVREKRGTKVDWEVKFERRGRRGNEILVYFYRTDELPLPSIPPVRLAKLLKTRAGDIVKCSRGEVIRVIGRLQRNSASQLFVQASEIRRR